MKSTVQFGFAVFAIVAICNSPSLWAAPTDSSPKVGVTKNPVRVTRDDFVSFSWQQTGGFAGISTTIEVQGNIISYSTSSRRFGGGNGIQSQNVPSTQGLSNNQLNQLIEKINTYNFIALVGNYRQKNLADGFNETAILTISDKNNQDQQFVIQNYGNAAPKGYVEFIAFFRSLAQMKFPSSSLAPSVSANATSNNSGI